MTPQVPTLAVGSPGSSSAPFLAAPRARSARYSALQFVKSLAIGSGYLAGAGLYR